jgi:hypothetical protein
MMSISMKPLRAAWCAFALLFVFSICTEIAAAQLRQLPPGKERVDGSWKRRTEIDGNNVRASVFNYLFSGRLGGGVDYVSYEWPKNTKRQYIALVALWIGGEVVDNSGNIVHIVDLPAFRTNQAGDDWNMLPIPKYFNDKRPGGGIIAKSDDPTSWPAVWPDKLVDSVDPGWPGKWNGYFGKNQFSADQEMFYRVGDDNYAKFDYTPDTTDRTRKGLGLIVDTRVMEWSQVSVQDAVFFIHEFRNDGTKDIRKVGTTIWLADMVGGDGDTQDDTPDFDLRQSVAFSLDKDGVSSNPFFANVCVGAVATSFMETPGNAVDRIDNDGDSPENPQTGNGPPVTFAMTQGEISGDGIDNNGNGLIDEDSTYIAFGTQKAATFADGIDNNDNGEAGSPVVTQQMIDDAATDNVTIGGTTYQWKRWPPNPESDPMQQGLDGKPIIHLIDVGPEDLGKRFKDNIDNNNNSNGYVNLPRVTQGMIDTAATDKYHRYRVPGTNVILYSLDSSSLGKKYLNIDGLRDAGVDENIDEMIDESRDDGIDNNGDWNPLTDDVGLDGAPNTHDFGEGDGKPTSGAGTPFPGEPHIDKTDVKEADMIGVTNVQYNQAGSINFSTSADNTFWVNFMTPGKFVDPAVIKAAGPGDYDLYVSSGFFPLKAGQTERVSYSVVFGNAVRCPGDADYTGAKADALRKRATAQLAYNENYQFAQVPIEPKVSAVAGFRMVVENGVTKYKAKVTLYWDSDAEQSFDRFLAGLGADPHDFEGYRIYRSTDPAFQDARLITDGFGNPAPFLKPMAQFDLQDGIKGFSPISYNGIMFDLGDDTGLKHEWVDTTAQFGQKYYYAVRAYDRGYAPLLITPSESNIRITIDNVTGQVREVGQSVAIITPEAPAAGYVPPNVGNITLVQGSTTGSVDYVMVDPTKILDHTYRITFEDTVLAGRANAPDTFKTKNFTLADITTPTAIDTLIPRSTALADTFEQPITNGFRLVMHNEKNFGVNPTLSGWNHDSVYAYNFQQWRNGFFIGVMKPDDYRIVIGSIGRDTSTQFKITASLTTPSVPVGFSVYNVSEKKKIQFAFAEFDVQGGAGAFSARYDPTFKSRSDIIVFLEKDSRDSLVITWAVTMTFDSTRRNPVSGDTLSVILSKLFRSTDVFEFTTKAQSVDPAKAKQDLDLIRVVPNPYVAAATWEERNPFSTGRGPRSIHFTHLPQKCTIRIFNVSGDLVTTIYHDSSLLDGKAEWNLLTRDNLPAAYGVYIFHVDAPGIGEKIGKFAVIK